VLRALCAGDGAGRAVFRAPAADHMVSRIALYPILCWRRRWPQATFPDQVSDASYWADEHHGLIGNELAGAIEAISCPGTLQFRRCFPSRRVAHDGV